MRRQGGFQENTRNENENTKANITFFHVEVVQAPSFSFLFHVAQQKKCDKEAVLAGAAGGREAVPVPVRRPQV